MPVAANNMIANAIPLKLREVSTISNIGLNSDPTLDPGSQYRYIDDGKTAWWTFDAAIEGWYIFDAIESGDGDTTQTSLSGEVYRIYDEDQNTMGTNETIYDYLQYEDGFYQQDPAWVAIYCYPSAVYYFMIDSSNYVGTYSARVRKGRVGDLISPPKVSVTATGTPDAPFINTTDSEGRPIFIGCYANKVTNTAPANITTQTPTIVWNALRGSFNGYSSSITRAAVGATATTRWPFGYFREGPDAGPMNWNLTYTWMQIQLIAYEQDTYVGLPEGGIVVAWDNNNRGEIDNVVLTANVLNQVDGVTGTPWAGGDTLRIEEQLNSISSSFSPLTNMTGTTNRTVYNSPDTVSAASTATIWNGFIYYVPTRVTDATPLPAVATSPFQYWMKGEFTLDISFDHTPRPYRVVYLDEQVGAVTGAQTPLGPTPESVGRASFW